MPKRIIDGERAWRSKKLARCREEHRVEYCWLYPLADANGNFEIDYRVIHGKVAAIRPSFHLDDLRRVLDDFERNGLLFTWTENGNLYGHWTGCEAPGLLPSPEHRKRYGQIGLERKFYAGDPEVAAYILECSSRPNAQAVMFNPDLARNARAEATIKMAENQKHNAESHDCYPFWKKFWARYPAHRRGNESETREKFFALGAIECQRSMELLEAWMKSDEWTRDSGRFIPQSDNGFFTDAKFRDFPPAASGKETDNGHRRSFGPASSSAEDKLQRFIKNGRIRGLL